MIATLVWDGNMHTASGHSWKAQMRHFAFDVTGAISTHEKQGWPVLDKVMIEHKSLSEGREMCFKYCQDPYIDIDIDFHLLCGKTGALAGWFHTFSGQWAC